MNVALVMVDSLRRDHVGCYGNPWIKTPNIDALAKESAMFTEAYPESLPTIQVRRSLHTGKRVYPIREFHPRKGDVVRHAGWEPVGEDQVTLAEILREAGYRTAFITDCFHQFKPSMNFHRGFEQWEWIRGQESDPYRSCLPPAHIDLDHYLAAIMKGTGIEKMLRRYFANTAERKTEEDYFAPQVFIKAMNWIEQNQDAEKLFLLVDCFDPHEPWDPPKHYVDLYDPGYEGKEIIRPLYGDASYLSEAELRHMRALYAGEVTMVDTWFGRFLDKLHELGLMENTLLIFMSDHGHPLGERGVVGKPAWALFPELLDIPMLVRHPDGVGAGIRCDEFVYSHDLFPTILALLGLEPPRGQSDGIDIWNYVAGKPAPKRKYVTSIFRNYVWAKDKEFSYMSRSDGRAPRLYDLKADPSQRKNIASERQDKVEEMFLRVLADAGTPIPDYEAETQTEDSQWFMPPSSF